MSTDLQKTMKTWRGIIEMFFTRHHEDTFLRLDAATYAQKTIEIIVEDCAEILEADGQAAGAILLRDLIRSDQTTTPANNTIH